MSCRVIRPLPLGFAENPARAKNLLDQFRYGKSIKSDAVVRRVNHHPDATPLKAQTGIIVAHRAGGELIEFGNAWRHERIVGTAAPFADQGYRGDQVLLTVPYVGREGLLL